MLDIAAAYNRYRFLGNEFLTWLWFLIETDSQSIQACDNELVELSVGNRMVLENRIANGLESVTIKGDAADLEEGILALRKGASVTEINLIYKSGSLEWTFSLKGENLSIAGLKLPESAPPESEEDMDGYILDKMYQFEKPILLIDQLYRFFIKQRLSEQWKTKTLADMQQWLTGKDSPSS